MFETQLYDERIKAALNKSGNIAFYVQTWLVMLMLFGYKGITGNEFGLLEWLVFAAVGISHLVQAVIQRNAGIDSQNIREDVYRIGKSGMRNRYFRLHRITLAGMVLLMIVYSVNFAADSPWRIFSRVTVWIAFGFLIYFMEQRSIGRKPSSLKSDEGGKQ